MKKFFVMLMIIAIVIMGNTYEVFLFAKKALFGDPTTHTIQQGEYLSKIAQHYYGRSDYWRELALINRAPNSDLVFPGEEIIIPRLEVIENIRKARSLSDVNTFVHGEEDIIARLDRDKVESIPMTEQYKPTPVTPKRNESTSSMITDESSPSVSMEEPTVEQPAPMVATNDKPVVNKPIQSSSMNLILVIVAVAVIGGIIGLLVYQRKKRSRFEEDFAVIDNVDLDEEPEDDDFVDAIAVEEMDDKAEPVKLEEDDSPLFKPIDQDLDDSKADDKKSKKEVVSS
ncbi:LysM peptidoglycan-binding domain-containing protein [candidate division KSB1 bacterium]|nr:LysM peptidoglycan-binding domain-containing protein [candidate division KSB1 bacterium]